MNEPKEIKAGVLEPNFILLYISDIPKFTNTTMATFAFGTAMLPVAHTKKEAKTRLLNSIIECTRR